MATIEENLQIIKESTAAMKSVIETNGGDVSGDITTWASAIDVIGNGGGGGEVIFYDYDGTILHSYTKSKFLALSSPPNLPTRDGLTCQGWNYTLANAQSYVRDYDKLDVGATYITDDGCTRLYIRIAAEGRMDVPLYFYQSASNGVVIDWGDNSPTETLSGAGNVNCTHTYANTGDYVISLRVANGTLGFGHKLKNYCVLGSTSSEVYANMLQKVEIGSGVTTIYDYAFCYCYSLKSVVIPNSVTSIGTYAFYTCYSLAPVVIPNSVTSIGTYAFYSCYSLTSIVIPNSVTSIGEKTFNSCNLASIVIPNSVTSIGTYAFNSCNLASIVIPNSVTSIGTYAFNNCRFLESVVIPDGVTSIGKYTFYDCRNLTSVTIPNSVTSIGSDAFHYCYSLASVVIPSNVTNMGGYTFNDCRSLESVVIPDGVTIIGSYVFNNCCSLASVVIPNSVTTISSSAFFNCRSLSSVVIPNSVTTIDSSAFANCLGVAFFDFTSHTAVPTLSYKSAFSNVASDFEIRVPSALVDEWKAATNWATYADNIIGY